MAKSNPAGGSSADKIWPFVPLNTDGPLTTTPGPGVPHPVNKEDVVKGK